MTNGQVVVSLGDMAVGDNRLELVKNINNAAEKPCEKILEDMLDGREDNLNPPYNAEENRLKDRIKVWRDQARTNSDQYKFDVMYIKPNGQLSEPLDRNALINRHNDAIKQKTRRGPFGEEVRYDALDLVARSEPVGGL